MREENLRARKETQRGGGQRGTDLREGKRRRLATCPMYQCGISHQLPQKRERKALLPARRHGIKETKKSNTDSPLYRGGRSEM